MDETMQDGAINSQTAAMLHAVFAPKVAGSAGLAVATATAPITCIAHFSSISALFGSPGQANYAAANEILNLTAQSQQASGMASVSVMWGPWALGMAAADPRLAARFERTGLGSIGPVVGIETLASTLQCSQATFLAARINWNRMMAANIAAAVAPVFASFRPPLALKLAESFSTLPHASNGTLAPAVRIVSREDVQIQIAEMVQALLGASVSDDQPLMEAGLDSLSAVEFRTQLSQAFGTDIPVTVTFDYPSIAALAGFVADTAASQLPAASVGEPGTTAYTEMDVLAELQAIIGTMIGSDVSVDQPLMEAGLDSLSAVELRNELGDKFGMELPATVMFDYPSIKALAGFIYERVAPRSSVALVPLSYIDRAALPVEPTKTSSLPTTDVVGISARYPGQTVGTNGFWETIMSAADLQRRVPFDRWDLESVYAVDVIPGTMTMNAPFAAFCDNVGYFDAAAFRMSPSEAIGMDPQQRLLMEEAQGALLDAAPRIADIAGSNTGNVHDATLLYS